MIFQLALLLAIRIPAENPEISNRQPQLAAKPGLLALTYGAGNSIYFVRSLDGGKTMSKPVLVSNTGKISLGMHRGPRIALTHDAIVISAVWGAKGGGADGDLLAWRSKDGGRTWSSPSRVNDVQASAREGLHSMVSDGAGLIFATWLDLRGKGTRLYGAVSRDEGATWSENRLVYESPSGSICQCCHPTAMLAGGKIYVMFRNELGGARDLYLVRSDDLGESFRQAEKLGSGTWMLNACPMDGGSLAMLEDGIPASIWRRDGNVFLSGAMGKEQLLGAGKNPVLAVSSSGIYAAWSAGKSLMLLEPGKTVPAVMDDDGAFPYLLKMPGGEVVAAWEQQGAIVVRILR